MGSTIQHNQSASLSRTYISSVKTAFAIGLASTVPRWLTPASTALDLLQRPPEHGCRRHHTRPEPENGRVSSIVAPR
jgi:hypothetical protein